MLAIVLIVHQGNLCFVAFFLQKFAAGIGSHVSQQFFTEENVVAKTEPQQQGEKDFDAECHGNQH